MKIVFSDHAKKRNLKRKIPKRYILETVRNPDIIVQSFRNRRLRRKQFGDKILEAVTITESDGTTIITQYWLEKGKE